MAPSNSQRVDQALLEIQQLLDRHRVLTTMARREGGALPDRKDLLE
jgi:hypothetical protein